MNRHGDAQTSTLIRQASRAGRGGGVGAEFAKVATTVNITLEGTQTIDGVAVYSGEAVLVRAQRDDYANGLYTVKAGAWVKVGEPTFVIIKQGTRYGRTAAFLYAPGEYRFLGAVPI